MESRINRRLVRDVVLIGAIALGSEAALKAAYGPGGTASWTGNIQHQTVNTRPANRDRTTLGLGEEVTCSIDPSTFTDWDFKCTAPGGREDDTLGTIAWSVSGLGSVSPAVGASTKFTASKTAAGATVQATITDSGTRYADAPIVTTQAFTVIAPTGLLNTAGADVALGVLGPPNNSIGAKTVINQTVLPTSVNFNKATLRENIPQQTWTWPNGAAGTRVAAIVPWNVGDGDWSVAGWNETHDNVSSGTFPFNNLLNGGAIVAFTIHITVPEEYQDGSGNWQSWLPNEDHPREFTATTGTCRVGVIANNTAYGAYQGPWQ